MNETCIKEKINKKGLTDMTDMTDSQLPHEIIPPIKPDLVYFWKKIKKTGIAQFLLLNLKYPILYVDVGACVYKYGQPLNGFILGI